MRTAPGEIIRYARLAWGFWLCLSLGCDGLLKLKPCLSSGGRKKTPLEVTQGLWLHFPSSWADLCHLCGGNPAVVSGAMSMVRPRLQGWDAGIPHPLGCYEYDLSEAPWCVAVLSPEALSLRVCSLKTSPSSIPWFPQKNLSLLD